ncbi:MAG: 2-dehydropantoate 2-reductase [Mucinivorans sp.]
MKNIILIGRGAVGAVYAVPLAAMAAKAITPISFRIAVDAERLTKYQATPFAFNGTQQNFDYFTPTQNDPKADLIIITTKWSGYTQALSTVAPLVGPQTTILPLLNGLAPYALATERWGEDRVLRGFYLGHTASRDKAGQAWQDGSYFTNFGQETNNQPYTARVEMVSQIFDAAGIKYKIPENMLGAAWQKLVVNIGTNLPTGLYRYNYGQLKASPRAMALSVALMQEAQRVAVALDVPSAATLVDNAMRTFDILQASDYSSMAQDTIAGRATEIDIFAGEIIRLGREKSIPTPHTSAFYDDFMALGVKA